MHSPHDPTAHARITVAVLCFGGLSASLMQTLMIPIQGELPHLLHTTPGNASWVITATLLAGAVSMPIIGRLGDMFGKQRVLFISACLLVAGSVVCGLFDTLLPMLVGRVLQGLSMGFIPVGISLIREVTPPHLAATAISAMSATLGVGAAIGLPVSAWLAQDFHWQLAFWLSAVLGLVTVLGVHFLVPHVRDAYGGRFDTLGAIGLSVGLTSVLMALSKGNEWGWTSARTLIAAALGVLVLLVWGAYELRHADALVDLRTSASAPVLLTNLAAIAIGFGLMAQAIVLPQLLEMPKVTGHGLGQSLIATGLWMAPSGLVMLLCAPISARLINNIGAKATLMIGSGILALGYVMSILLMDAPWTLLLASIAAGVGVGIAYAAMPTLILAAVPPSESGSALGVNALMRSVGTSSAAAMMVAVLTGLTTTISPELIVPAKSAFQWCFALGALAALLGVAIAATIPSASSNAGLLPRKPGRTAH